MVPFLSKSKFTAGIQCLRRLWLEVDRPELAPPLDPVTAALFATGTRVGELARQCFPGGALVENAYYEHDQATARTAELLRDPGVPAIFEAAFTREGVRIRVDVLRRSTSGWQLVEVKSSSSLKAEHIPDLAIQHYVLAGCGVKPESDHLMHVDTGYVYDGQTMDAGKLLAIDGATDQVAEALDDLPAQLELQRQTLAGPDEPTVDPGYQCASPWECPYVDYCTRDKPRYWIKRLLGITRREFDELTASGMDDIRDIPDDYPLSERPARARQAAKSGRPWVSDRLGGELARVKTPIQFLDFETVSSAIPLYAGTRPYQVTPFQWSLYTVDRTGAMTDRSFLFDQDGDPRRAVAESLLTAIGTKGSIVAYNAGFEITVLRNLAEALPDLADRLLALLDRVVDLLTIVRRCYYHADLLGSFSLKQVVPVLVPDCSYGDLAIQDGSIASLEHLRMIAQADPQERQRIRTDLLDYCKRDTWAMVRVWEELGKLAGRGS